MKRVIKFKVVGVYEDDSEDVFETFGTYEEAQKYIETTKYEAEEFRIDKVWVKEKKRMEEG